MWTTYVVAALNSKRINRKAKQRKVRVVCKRLTALGAKKQVWLLRYHASQLI
jgi:hypothetical protein